MKGTFIELNVEFMLQYIVYGKFSLFKCSNRNGKNLHEVDLVVRKVSHLLQYIELNVEFICTIFI
jgi:hypothetical protein